MNGGQLTKFCIFAGAGSLVKNNKTKFFLDHMSVFAVQVEHGKVVLVFHTHEAHYQKFFPNDVQC